MKKTTVGGKTYYLGTGRRKTSVARVRICEGSGKIIVNHRSFDEFFTEEKDRGAVAASLVLLDMRNRIDVKVNVHGGGITGQAGAILQGLARALKVMFSPPPGSETAEGETTESGIIKKLRDSGYLTRDSRMKERKKYGKKGARKSFQFSKR